MREKMLEMSVFLVILGFLLLILAAFLSVSVLAYRVELQPFWKLQGSSFYEKKVLVAQIGKSYERPGDESYTRFLSNAKVVDGYNELYSKYNNQSKSAVKTPLKSDYRTIMSQARQKYLDKLKTERNIV